MYPKFVLVSRPETPLIGTFIYGLVWNHKDLVDALPAYVKVHGGGWYDRLLAATAGNALKIGVAHEFQIVDDLPCEQHDVLLDRVVTSGFFFT